MIELSKQPYQSLFFQTNCFSAGEEEFDAKYFEAV